MLLLEFTLVFILFEISFLASYPFRYDSTKINPINRDNNIYNDYPTVVIIGATSKRGQFILKSLEDKKLNLIAVSRRETKWIKIRDNFPNVLWLRGDIRLSHDMDNLFTKIRQRFGSIDFVINLSYLSGSIEDTSVRSLKVKNSVIFKLDNAYDQNLLSRGRESGSLGEENSLYTNLIGHIILKNVTKKYHCHKVIMVLGNDSVVNELIYNIERENKGRTQFISVEPQKIEEIKDMIYF